MFRFATPHTLGLFVVAGAASLWAVAGGPAAHAAPPASCQAPGAVSVQNGEAGATCSANSAAGGAAAAYGLDGRATADAAPTSLSLAVAQNGGTAASASQFLSGPAAIAVGPDAQTTVIGARPGLSIGIAGPGATVTVTGTSTPTCTGGPGFAGDFQTLQGCVSTG
ncbi:MAG: protein kinase [Nocardia sp.]|nr:protein kinase [Nocardia sp.]